MKHNESNMKIEALEKIKECLENRYSGMYCDLYEKVFNAETDNYTDGFEDARQALEEFGVFKAIDILMEFEDSDLGAVEIDIFDPEGLVNMLFYVIVVNTIAGIKSIDDSWSEHAECANEETNKKIITEINSMLENLNLT